MLCPIPSIPLQSPYDGPSSLDQVGGRSEHRLPGPIRLNGLGIGWQKAQHLEIWQLLSDKGLIGL
jgi:hypothetical protein